MSYSVVRDKQFIKVTEDTFIPLAYIADSSLRECHNNAMVCNWCTIDDRGIGQPIARKLEDMLSDAESFLHDKFERSVNFAKNYSEKIPTKQHISENFGWYTGLYINGNRSTTFGMYKGIFKTGCKKALTIEEIQEVVTTNVHISDYESNFSRYCSTTEEIIVALREAEQYEIDSRNRVYVSINLDKRDCKRLRTAYFSKIKVIINDKVLSKILN